MTKNLDKVKVILESGNYTLVICSGTGEIIHASEKSGIKPLIEAIDSNIDFRNAYAADKIVGKAAAMMYALLGVKYVFAQVMSKPALKVLESCGIEYDYDTLTENIINRQGTGLCPMEEAVADINSPEEAKIAITKKIVFLSNNSKK